jgi:type II restriction/modification system DNA methylase subunit YeeA
MENTGRAFPGSKKHGSFDIPGDLARQWLKLPNPHGQSNADVLKPLWNGLDMTRRPRDTWVIDFGTKLAESEAALYERPFEYVRLHVKSERESNNREQYRRYWWQHGEPRVALRSALEKLYRYATISEKSKHFYFIWLPVSVLPDNRLIVIARDDDTTFGTVSSRFHRAWALRVGSKLEDRPCYTPTTCFQTFPFPEGLTPNISANTYADDPRAQCIAGAAKRLNELREAWLNPPDLVVRVPEVVPGYPDRILPKDEEAAKELKERTLTNLYNQRPAWLDNIHKELDAAVAAAYGWPADLTDDEILERLFELNQQRAGVGRAAATAKAAAAV